MPLIVANPWFKGVCGVTGEHNFDSTIEPIWLGDKTWTIAHYCWPLLSLAQVSWVLV